jgi:hypothetical protein
MAENGQNSSPQRTVIAAALAQHSMLSLIMVRVIHIAHNDPRANSVQGLLPRDGRNISFKEATRQCRNVYNFSATFSYYVPNHMANLLGKSYSKDTFDLEEISLHNGIEHDASLTRTFFLHILRHGGA